MKKLSGHYAQNNIFANAYCVSRKKAFYETGMRNSLVKIKLQKRNFAARKCAEKNKCDVLYSTGFVLNFFSLYVLATTAVLLEC